MSRTEIGTILQSSVGTNGDGQDDVLLCQTQMTEDGDIQTIQELSIPGIQYNPSIGSKGFISRISTAWKVFKGIYDLVGRESLNPGEVLIYSSTGSVMMAKIKMKNTGKIAIGNAAFELKDLMNELIDEIKGLTTYGSPASHSVTAASQATLTALNLKFNAILDNF